MTKNFAIGALLFLVVMLVLRPDPEDLCTNDPNTVVIEYECSNLDVYENVPPEVVEECRSRAEETIKRSNKKLNKEKQ
jgi:hypothetical protein